MKLPDPARIVQGLGMEPEYLYTREQVMPLLEEANKDFSDGMMVVHLQVVDQMQRRYEPVLKMALDALHWTTPIGSKPVKQTQDAMDAIRKVLA